MLKDEYIYNLCLVYLQKKDKQIFFCFITFQKAGLA